MGIQVTVDRVPWQASFNISPPDIQLNLTGKQVMIHQNVPGGHSVWMWNETAKELALTILKNLPDES